jgi:hypothetical protein
MPAALAPRHCGECEDSLLFEPYTRMLVTSVACNETCSRDHRNRKGQKLQVMRSASMDLPNRFDAVEYMKYKAQPMCLSVREKSPFRSLLTPPRRK